jgi:hypothetical protein
MTTVKVTIAPVPTVPLPAVIEVPEVPMEETTGAVVSIFNVRWDYRAAIRDRKALLLR